MEKFYFQKIKLGLLVIVGAALFIIGFYLIGRKQSMFGNTYDIYAVFNNINGLKPGNNVRYSGINVGTVGEISMVTDTMIVVKMTIEKEITQHIRKDARCAITSDGLVGSMIINILPGGSDKAGQITRGDTLQSFTRIRTDEMLSTFNITNENAALLTIELLKIVNDISKGRGVLGALIQDSVITHDVKDIIANLKETTSQTSATIQKLDRMLVSLDRNDNLVGTLRDTTLSPMIKNMVSNLEQSSADIRTLITSLNETVKHTQETVLNAKDGKGAINYLSNDEGFVQKMDTTMVHLDSAIYQINKAGIQLNENLEALKHTWLLRRYFKNREKE
jgi:phospholipid/cholesterol/gamma-HCH transport system substrate-binding protein